MMALFIAVSALALYAGSYVATWLHNWFVAFLCVALAVALIDIGMTRYPRGVRSE